MPMSKLLKFIRQDLSPYILFPLTFVLCLSLVYLGSRPKQYALSINDVSPYDIEAPRNVVDRKATEKRALEARAQVPDVFSRSEEQSQQSLELVKAFINTVETARLDLPSQRAEHSDDREYMKSGSRKVYYADGLALKKTLAEDLGLMYSVPECVTLLVMPNHIFSLFADHTQAIAEAVMADNVSIKDLAGLINQQYTQSGSQHIDDQDIATLLQNSLRRMLDSNLIYNEEATRNARDEAYDRIMQNPSMINRGSRFISAGEVINENTYAILKDLSLVDTYTFDWLALAGQALMILLTLTIMTLCLQRLDPDLMKFNRPSLALLTAFFIPLLLTAYLGFNYQLSPPIYFTAVVVSAYFGFRAALVVSFSLIVICMPLVNFNPAFAMVAICGSILAAHYTRSISSKNIMAKLVLFIAASNLLAATSYLLMQGGKELSFGAYIASSVISGILSVVAAIGLMPLFEMLFQTVSPVTLIDLSQPGNPLLRRLFLEAPGTSQHSIMVANLADAAAEAIGADSLLCRVGAYYHDIGKLRNPLYFTENQYGYNPHDMLTPEESAEVIIRHPRDGRVMGKQHRLPEVVLDMIEEHHGTTVLEYFYNEAKQVAKAQGKPLPDETNFRYPGPLPSSPESAIIMLADSTQAAIKSVGKNDVEAAQQMIDRVFRIKIDQNQLKESGLSFADLDKIRQAFSQVYQGHFHERIKYPDEKTQDRQSSFGPATR